MALRVSFYVSVRMYNLYRMTNSTNYVKELLKSFYPNSKNDIRKKKVITDRWSSYIIEYLFSTKLNKWGLQRKTTRPFFFTPGGTSQLIVKETYHIIFIPIPSSLPWQKIKLHTLNYISRSKRTKMTALKNIRGYELTQKSIE